MSDVSLWSTSDDVFAVKVSHVSRGCEVAQQHLPRKFPAVAANLRNSQQRLPGTEMLLARQWSPGAACHIT